MPIKLSIKNLAGFALPDYCPHCAWVKHLLGYNYPFSIFPGIFSTIDSHCKKICDFWLNDTGTLPPWLESLFPGYKPIKVPHYTKTTIAFGEIETRGSTDYILGRDGNLVILDNKTSHFKDADDPLALLYDVQLNACGMALEKNGFGKVRSLHLVYYDPIRLEPGAKLPFIGTNPALEFEVKIRDVAIDPGLVERTAAEAFKVLSLPKPPSGVDGCKDCLRLEMVLSAARVGVL